MRSRIGAHAAGRVASAYSAWLCGCLLLLTHPAEALTIRTVAITGETAPATSGATYTSFDLSTLNASGEVSFTALLEQTGGVDATNDLGVWPCRYRSRRLARWSRSDCWLSSPHRDADLGYPASPGKRS